MSYGQSNAWAEWGKWFVFRFGNIFGFSQMSLAAIIGCIIWFFSWVILPDAYRTVLAVKPIAVLLRDAGVSLNTVIYVNWGLVALGTWLGICCWCRVAVLSNPTVFDRYKIKGISL